jgi:hypothetical protein
MAPKIKIRKSALIAFINEALGASVSAGTMSTALSIPAVGGLGGEEGEEDLTAPIEPEEKVEPGKEEEKK